MDRSIPALSLMWTQDPPNIHPPLPCDWLQDPPNVYPPLSCDWLPTPQMSPDPGMWSSPRHWITPTATAVHCSGQYSLHSTMCTDQCEQFTIRCAVQCELCTVIYIHTIGSTESKLKQRFIFFICIFLHLNHQWQGLCTDICVCICVCICNIICVTFFHPNS